MRELPQPTMSLQVFLSRFNPDSQMVLCKNPQNCWFGNYPTLADINRLFGDNISEDWLTAQLDNLMSYCGCKEKLNESQLYELPGLISSNYSYLRITEMMLFFWYFKCGRYERFYGVMDPLKIMTSLETFVSVTRAEAYAAKEKEIESEYRKSYKESAITEEEYLKNKGMATADSKFGKIVITPSVTKKLSFEQKRPDILDSALALTNNTYGFAGDVLAKMCESWKAKYGCSPEEYVINNKNKKG